MLVPVLNLQEHFIYLGQILSNLNLCLNMNMCFARSSREEVFHEKGVLKSFTKSTEKTFDEVSF